MSVVDDADLAGRFVDRRHGADGHRGDHRADDERHEEEPPPPPEHAQELHGVEFRSSRSVVVQKWIHDARDPSSTASPPRRQPAGDTRRNRPAGYSPERLPPTVFRPGPPFARHRRTRGGPGDPPGSPAGSPCRPEVTRRRAGTARAPAAGRPATAGRRGIPERASSPTIAAAAPGSPPDAAGHGGVVERLQHHALQPGELLLVVRKSTGSSGSHAKQHLAATIARSSPPTPSTRPSATACRPVQTRPWATAWTASRSRSRPCATLARKRS